jgi:isopenicillin N synthase-like dioxygenase
MPFFCEPNPETVISCLPNCFDEEHPALFPDVKAGDWLLKRFKQTYAYRADNEEKQ